MTVAIRNAFISSSLLALSGCGGLHFADTEAPFDGPFPAKLNSAVDPRSYRYDLNALNGNIALYDPSGPTLRAVRPAYPSTGLPKITIIPAEQGQIYKSILTSTANAGVDNPIAKLQLDASHSAQVTVTDVAQSIIEAIPVAEIADVYRKMGTGGTASGTYYVYIRTVTLTDVKTNILTQIDANASGVVGPAFGVNGKVYNESQTDVDDYIITVDAVKLSEIFPNGIDEPTPHSVPVQQLPAKIVDPGPAAPPLPAAPPPAR